MTRLGFNEYQKAAAETAAHDTMKVEIAGRQNVLVGCALGLSGESGEFTDLIKKIAYHAHPLDHETHDKLCKELGDILWYVAMAATSLAVDMRSLAEENLAKLKARYPEGFSTEKSLGRYMEKVRDFAKNYGGGEGLKFDREAARQAAEKALEEDSYDLNADYHKELEDNELDGFGN